MPHLQVRSSRALSDLQKNRSDSLSVPVALRLVAVASAECAAANTANETHALQSSWGGVRVGLLLGERQGGLANEDAGWSDPAPATRGGRPWFKKQRGMGMGQYPSTRQAAAARAPARTWFLMGPTALKSPLSRRASNAWGLVAIMSCALAAIESPAAPQSEPASVEQVEGEDLKASFQALDLA